MENKDKEYPEGHFIGMWIGIGIAIFSGIGIPLSIISKSPAFIGIGPALGVSIGVAIGSSIEAKYKKDGKIRPLNDKERQVRKNLIITGIAILIIGIGIAILLFRYF